MNPRTMATAFLPNVKEYYWKVVVTEDALENVGEERLEKMFREEARSTGFPIPDACVKDILRETFNGNEEEVFYSWTWKWFAVEFEDEAIDTNRIIR